jgi:hypothetical protein
LDTGGGGEVGPVLQDPGHFFVGRDFDDLNVIEAVSFVGSAARIAAPVENEWRDNAASWSATRQRLKWLLSRE